MSLHRLDKAQPERPTPAGMYDHYLGGTTNSAADRAAAERVRQRVPEIGDAAWANRGFLTRATKWCADQGIRQFIDLGAGLPTQNPVHQVVQGTGSHVVYVDIDPWVAEQARPLLLKVPGAAAITADLRDPTQVLSDIAGLIDLREPVALLMVAVLHFVSDADDPWRIVRSYLGALAPGSYLVLSHATTDHQPDEVVHRLRDVYTTATEQLYLRTLREVERFFTGLDLVRPHPHMRPAVTYVGDWGAEDIALSDSEGSRLSYCGVARLPQSSRAISTAQIA